MIKGSWLSTFRLMGGVNFGLRSVQQEVLCAPCVYRCVCSLQFLCSDPESEWQFVRWRALLPFDWISVFQSSPSNGARRYTGLRTSIALELQPMAIPPVLMLPRTPLAATGDYRIHAASLRIPLAEHFIDALQLLCVDHQSQDNDFVLRQSEVQSLYTTISSDEQLWNVIGGL